MGWISGCGLWVRGWQFFCMFTTWPAGRVQVLYAIGLCSLSLCSCYDLGRYILTCLYFHSVLGAQEVSLQLLSMILSSTHSGCFWHAVPWPPFSHLLVQPPVLLDACCIFSTWFSLVFESSTEEENYSLSLQICSSTLTYTHEPLVCGL